MHIYMVINKVNTRIYIYNIVIMTTTIRYTYSIYILPTYHFLKVKRGKRNCYYHHNYIIVCKKTAVKTTYYIIYIPSINNVYSNISNTNINNL